MGEGPYQYRGTHFYLACQTLTRHLIGMQEEITRYICFANEVTSLTRPCQTLTRHKNGLNDPSTTTGLFCDQGLVRRGCSVLSYPPAPPLPSSLRRGCSSLPAQNSLSNTSAVQQFIFRYRSPSETFPGEHHVKL